MEFLKLWLKVIFVIAVFIALCFTVYKIGDFVTSFISRFFNLPYFSVLAVILFFAISAALAMCLYE